MSAVSMNSVLAPIGIIALILILVFLAKALRSKGLGLPYKRTSFLFSPAERHFLTALDRALGPKYRVFGKVRMADLAEVKAGLTQTARRGALNRIAYKHFDYVVCTVNDLSVVCVVELNDSSHANNRAKKRDELVSNLCRNIGLPLLCVTARREYDQRELIALFERVAYPGDAAGQNHGT